MVVLAIDYSNFCFYYSFWFAPCKAIWIPESRSFFDCGIRNPANVYCGIRDPTFWNPEYSSSNP